MECDACAYYVWDDDFEEYVCEAQMDEDDLGRVMREGRKSCPYFRDGDEYMIARKQ